MNHGFENGKFFVDIKSCDYIPSDMRDANDKRALELAKNGDKILLSFSSGLDSQSVFLSFRDIGIIPETYFVYMPGYNDFEYENIKIVDEKFQIKTNIIDFDINILKQNLLDEAALLDVTPLYALWHRFLKLLPSDGTFIQMAHDPFVYISTEKKFYYYLSYYSPEVMRDRAFNTVERNGDYVFYGNNSEMLYSILNDDIFKAALRSHEYFDGNGLSKDGASLKTVDRWDYYIKPLLYGKYWKDELIYFPKFAGHFNVDWMQTPMQYRKHGIFFEFNQLLSYLESGSGKTKRYFENLTL